MFVRPIALREFARSDSPDNELVTSAQAGEPSAFGALYDRYLDPIYRYIHTRVGNQVEAQDLTELVFLKAYERIGDYEERGHQFSAYLYRIARNVVVDYHRQRRLESIDLLNGAQHPDPGPDEQVVQREHARTLRVALHQLPSDYQEVIRLRVLMELPTAQVAFWMDRSDGAVRALLYRALKALRSQVGEPNGVER